MNRRRLLALLGLIPAAATALPVVQAIGERRRPGRVRPARGYHAEYFPNVRLRTHDGERVRLYGDLLQGKTVVVSFLCVTCADGTCPLVTRNLVRLQQLLGDRCGRDVFMVSLALAPDQDTPERLRHYREEYNVGPGWTFLTGSARDLELCRTRFGLADRDPEQDRARARHTGVVLLGNEPHQRWMATPALTNPEYLLEQINRVAGLQA